MDRRREADSSARLNRLLPRAGRAPDRAEKARTKQTARLRGAMLTRNADMDPSLDEPGRGLLKAAMRQFGLSTRAYHRILKLARTVADLAGSERIQNHHLAEAIQYRPRRSE